MTCVTDRLSAANCKEWEWIRRVVGQHYFRTWSTICGQLPDRCWNWNTALPGRNRCWMCRVWLYLTQLWCRIHSVLNPLFLGLHSSCPPGMGETVIFWTRFQQFQFQKCNSYKITVCSTTWYDTYSIEVPSVPLLQWGDPVLFMFQTWSNSSLQVRKSTDMVQHIK
jgi:hypothetical protein